jgi:hypothetical protein
LIASRSSIQPKPQLNEHKKVVPIERASEEAWAGVAAVDRGESDENALDWGRVALLVGGDATALLLFAAVGRANHGEGLAGALGTAAPFLLGMRFFNVCEGRGGGVFDFAGSWGPPAASPRRS